MFFLGSGFSLPWVALQPVFAPARFRQVNGMRSLLSNLSLLLTVMLVSQTVASAQDWTHWRGPEQNGISRETNLPDAWSLEGEKNVAWTSDIGGRATPVILNGRVYLNCRTEHDFNDPVEKIHLREQVVCWDLKTGELLWQDRFNVFQTDIPAPRVGWAAMAGDKETGYVYVHSVICLNTKLSPIGPSDRFQFLNGQNGRSGAGIG